MNSIRFFCRIICASRIPRLRASGSDIVWYMGFELGLLVGTILVAPAGYPLEDSINMLLGLALGSYFGK